MGSRCYECAEIYGYCSCPVIPDPRIRSKREDFVIWAGLSNLEYCVANNKFDSDFPISLEEVEVLAWKLYRELGQEYVRSQILEGIEKGAK
jgi:hypothetical protein